MTDAPRAAAATMVLVPAGDFWMGSDTQLPNRGPRHLVSLDAFEIDRFEVTNERFKRFIDARGYGNAAWWSADGLKGLQHCRVTKPSRWGQAGWSDPLQPVVGVSWYEAEAFCNFEGVRLPTEAEWEKAARGTDERDFPWGSQWNAANAQGPRAVGTALVGAHAQGASPYGAEDMAGNAWEWVADWYLDRYAAGAPGNNPKGPANGTEKVLRGGSWRSPASGSLNVTDRDMLTVDDVFCMRFDTVGFRCARSVA